MAWENLPENIVVDILSYLSCKERCRVSAICQSWRQSLYAGQLWRIFYIDIDVQSSKSGSKLNFMNRFVKYARHVKIIWTSTKQTANKKDIVNGKYIEHFFYRMEKDCEKLKSLKLRFGDRQSHQEDFYGPISQSLEIILCKNPSLGYISFGGHPHFTPNDLNSVLLRGKVFDLEDLHCDLSRNYRKYKPLLSETYVMRLQKLKYLSLNWGEVTAPLIEGLLNGGALLKQFSIFISPPTDRSSHSDFNISMCPHPSEKQWKYLAEKNRELSLHLVFMDDCPTLDITDALNYICNVTMFKFVECMYIDQTTAWLPPLAFCHRTTLKSLVFVNTKRMIDFDNVNMMIGHGYASPKLEQLTFIGYSIMEEDLAKVVHYFRTSLKLLQVTKKQIFTQSEVTNYCVPTSSSKYNDFKQKIESELEMPWEALSKVPLKPLHYCDGKDDQYYLTGHLPKEDMQGQ